MKNIFASPKLKFVLVGLIALLTSIWGGLILRERHQARQVYRQSVTLDHQAGLRMCRTPDCLWSHRFCTPENGGFVCRTYWNRNTSSVRMRAVHGMICNNAPRTSCYDNENECPTEDLTISPGMFWLSNIQTNPNNLVLDTAPNMFSCQGGDLVVTLRLPVVSHPAWRLPTRLGPPRSTLEVTDNLWKSEFR